MKRYHFLLDIRDFPHSFLEKSLPFTDKEKYNNAKKYVAYYYQYTRIFDDPFYDYPSFSKLFEMYSKSEETKYWDLIQLLVNIKTLKKWSDEYGNNMANPWLRTLVKELKMFIPFVHDLLIIAYDNKMFNSLDYSNLPPPLAYAYRHIDQIKAQREERLNQFYKTLEEQPNFDDDIEAYFLEKEKYKLGETKKKKQAISLEEEANKNISLEEEANKNISLKEEANKRKPDLPTLNHYYNDTDDSDTEEEFDYLLRLIRSNQTFIESFIDPFDNNSLISLYAEEKPEEFEELVQNYCNYKAIGDPCTDYDKKNADKNCLVSQVYYFFRESIQKFLAFASHKGKNIDSSEWSDLPDEWKNILKNYNPKIESEISDENNDEDYKE